MKRLICLMLGVTVLLCSCSGIDMSVEIDIHELMDSILASQEFESEMLVFDDTDEEYGDTIDQIIGIQYSEAAMTYPAVGISADMVIIVEALDEENRADIIDFLETYQSERYEAYKGYAPVEADKIDRGGVVTVERYVIFMVLPDIDAAETAIKQAFADK